MGYVKRYKCPTCLSTSEVIHQTKRGTSLLFKCKRCSKYFSVKTVRPPVKDILSDHSNQYHMQDYGWMDIFLKEDSLALLTVVGNLDIWTEEQGLRWLKNKTLIYQPFFNLQLTILIRYFSQQAHFGLLLIMSVRKDRGGEWDRTWKENTLEQLFSANFS